MTRLKAPVLYFMLVYLAGFALGTAREFLIMPAVGLTNALLIETPIMAVIALAWVLLRINEGPSRADVKRVA